MIQKNRYFRHSKLSEAKLRQILRYFAMDLTATDCAELSGISVRSINTIYLRLRRRMAEQCEKISPLRGELEAVLHQGETLSEFVETSVRNAVAFRCMQTSFQERGQAAWEHFQQTGASVPASDVVAKLQTRLDAKRKLLAR